MPRAPQNWRVHRMIIAKDMVEPYGLDVVDSGTKGLTLYLRGKPIFWARHVDAMTPFLRGFGHGLKEGSLRERPSNV